MRICKNYSIYVAEVLCSEITKTSIMPTWDDIDNTASWYHCFLMLMDETNGHSYKAKILQQLHFDKHQGLMVPALLENDDRYNTIRDLDLFPYVSGNSDQILSMWNEILGFATQIKESRIYFSRDFKYSTNAVNCRTGVKASLTKVGLTFCDEFAKSTAGTHPKDFPFPDAVEITSSQLNPERIQQQHIKLSQTLKL